MTKFIPREKMSKKARRELDRSQRRTWDYSSVSRRIENKKRGKLPCIRHEEYGAGDFSAFFSVCKRFSCVFRLTMV